MQEYLEGTSPFRYDKEWYDYVWDFIFGAIAGDFIEETDSVATLLGQIAGSCIPLIDIRDVVAELAKSDEFVEAAQQISLVAGSGLTRREEETITEILDVIKRL